MITDREIKGTFIQSPRMLNGPEHIRYVHEELGGFRNSAISNHLKQLQKICDRVPEFLQQLAATKSDNFGCLRNFFGIRPSAISPAKRMWE